MDFDTHKLIKTLTAENLNLPAAEAIAYSLRDNHKILLSRQEAEEKLATKKDIQNIQYDIEKLRADTKHNIEKLRANTDNNIAKLRTDTDNNIAKLRADTKHNIEKLRLSTQKDISESTKKIIFSIMGLLIAQTIAAISL